MTLTSHPLGTGINAIAHFRSIGPTSVGLCQLNITRERLQYETTASGVLTGVRTLYGSPALNQGGAGVQGRFTTRVKTVDKLAWSVVDCQVRTTLAPVHLP
jgi:hypothetical protein